MEDVKNMFCRHCGSQLNSEIAFCPKCGQKVEGEIIAENADAQSGVGNTTVDNASAVQPGTEGTIAQPAAGSDVPQPTVGDAAAQTKPKKKAKVWLIILVVLLVLIAGCVGLFFYLLKSGYLYQNGYLKDIYNMTGRCLEHHYLPADCVTPETCEICQGTRGEANGHSWNPATCEKAKECSVCFTTDGAPLGHTVRMGKCGNCGEFQYELKDELYTILRKEMDGNDYFLSGNKLCTAGGTSLYATYLGCSSANAYFVKAKKEFQKAYDSCGSYEEFATLKTKLKKILDTCPTTAPSYSYDSCISYLEKGRDCLVALAGFSEYTLDLLKQWNLTSN